MKRIKYLLSFLFLLLSWGSVFGAPNLQVSVSPDIIMLGGKAVYNISITNTGTSKGYNLSIKNTFSSNPGPNRSVVFANASDGLTPSSDTSLANGDRELEFVDIKDLAPNETYLFALEVDMSGDNTWQSMDDIINAVEATVVANPDGTGATTTGTASDTSDVLPIALKSKTTLQSTGVEQATGVDTHPYQYQLVVQNNYLSSTNNVSVTDSLPDGIEYTGVASGHNCNSTRDNATGITDVVCDLGTMAPGATETILLNVGIRYDYFGTNNGGTNRAYNDFSSTLGTPIPDKTTFINTATLNSPYDGQIPANVRTKTSDVVAAYAIISKSASISEGGNGTTITYTLKYTASEYYDVLDSITIHDHLPDGQTFIGNSSPTETSDTINADGSTDIYWDSTILNNLPAGQSFEITFDASIDEYWNDGTTPVVAADGLKNQVDSDGTWDDQVDTSRPNSQTQSSAESTVRLKKPTIVKEVEDPNNPGTWLAAISATIGDILKFRVRFNTNDGSSAVVADTRFGDITVTDWLPRGMSYISNSAVETFSNSTDFSNGGDPNTETSVSISSLNGIEWFLGDVNKAGWWQAIFNARVEDDSYVADGKNVDNIWKQSGINSFGNTYSDRSKVQVTYIEPDIAISKNISNAPNPLKPGDTVEYTVVFTNNGQATAKDILFTDQVSNFSDGNSPTLISVQKDGITLTEGTDYNTPQWDSNNNTYTIDFNTAPDNTGIETNLDPGESITVVYSIVIDNNLGAGSDLNNTASVSYNSQDDASGRLYSDSDSAWTQLPDLSIDKNVNSGPYTIGDTISYNLEITVPQGQVAYLPEVVDVFDKDGVSYVLGSATLTNISGSPVAGASFDVGNSPDPIIITNVANNTELNWKLNQIDNRGQNTDYVFRLSYDVIYNGLDDGGNWEFFTPTGTDQVNNTADVNWSSDQNAGNTNNSASDSAVIDIDQPLLRTTKSITSTGPYSADDIITYQVVIENVGGSTAYDISWEDDYDQNYVENPQITSITHSNSGALVDGTNFTVSTNTNNGLINIDFDGGTTDTNLAVGETITIEYTLTVKNPVVFTNNITNREDVDWSSNNGSIDERIYDDSSEEIGYTDDTDSASALMQNVSFTKTVSKTEVTIGEEFDYTLTANFPAEITFIGASIQDIIPDGLTVLSATPNDASIGATPTFTENANGTTNVNWDLGDVTNSTTDPLILTIRARVDDAYFDNNQVDGLPTGTDGDPQDTFINNASLNWTDGDNQSQSVSDTKTVTVVEPNPIIAKNIDQGAASTGDTRTYTVVLSNNGTVPLYNINFQDQIPTDLFSAGTSPTNMVVTPSSGTVSPSVNLNTNPITVSFGANDSILPGESITFVYEVQVDSQATNGILTNNASFTGSSERAVDNSDARARNYSGNDSADIIISTTSLGDKVWFDVDKNGVQDMGEPGFANVTIRLYEDDGITPVKDPANPTQDYVVQTDTNGNYNFVNLPSGNYRVRVQLPTGYDFTDQNQGGDDNLDSDVTGTGLSNIVNINPGDHISNLDAGIKGASIAGNVWNDTDGDGTSNESNTGLSGVGVHLLDDSGNPVDDPLNPGTPYIVQTDANGNYIFENLSAGNYKVKFDDLNGYMNTKKDQGSDNQDSDANPGDGTTDTINLTVGEEKVNVDAGKLQPASLSGLTWDDSNSDGIRGSSETTGYGGINVTLVDANGNPISDPITGQPYSTTTAPDGSYQFNNLFPGTYQVKFDVTGYNISPQDVGGDDAVDSDIDITNFTTGPITLNSGDNSVNNDAGVKKIVRGSSGKKTSSKEYKCKDSKAINFSNTGIHKQSLCKYEEEEEEKEEVVVEEKEKKKEEPGVVEKPTSDKCKIYIVNEIKPGQENNEEDVRRLQEFLNQYEGESLEIDGEYGSTTIAAVNRYQRKYYRDILYPWRYTQPTSSVFTTMRGHINDKYRKENQCNQNLQCEYGKFTKYLWLGSSGAEVEKVQKFLRDLGFYNDKIDGIYGAETVQAVKDFQNENAKDILQPWGIPCVCGTGYWYQSTLTYANKVAGCTPKTTPLPKLNHKKKKTTSMCHR